MALWDAAFMIALVVGCTFFSSQIAIAIRSEDVEEKLRCDEAWEGPEAWEDAEAKLRATKAWEDAEAKLRATLQRQWASFCREIPASVYEDILEGAAEDRMFQVDISPAQELKEMDEGRLQCVVEKFRQEFNAEGIREEDLGTDIREIVNPMVETCCGVASDLFAPAFSKDLASEVQAIATARSEARAGVGKHGTWCESFAAARAGQFGMLKCCAGLKRLNQVSRTHGGCVAEAIERLPDGTDQRRADQQLLKSMIFGASCG